MEVIDFNVGGRFIDDQSGVATVFLDYHFFLKNLSERHAFIARLYTLAGKWGVVWVASGQHDFTLVNAIANGAAAITVKYTGLSAYGITAAKQDLKISLKNGTSYCRRITGVVNNGNGTETLTLNQPMSTGVLLNQVLIISYLMLMRLSADFISVEHYSSEVSQCSVMFQSVNDFYNNLALMPPMTQQGGWYGGELSGAEVWITSVYQSSNYGEAASVYSVNKITAATALIGAIPTDYGRRRVAKVGSYWLTLAATLELRDLSYQLVFAQGFWNGLYDVALDVAQSAVYVCVNIGGAWGFLQKLPLTGSVDCNNPNPPPNAWSGEDAFSWIYSPAEEQGMNAQGVLADRVVLDGEFVWTISRNANLLSKLRKNPTALSAFPAPEQPFPWRSNKYQTPVLTLSLDMNSCSEMAVSPENIWVTLPGIAKLAKIAKATGAVTLIDVPGLLNTNEQWSYKPSYCVWLHKIKALLVSCVSDSTVKLYSENGVWIETFNTGALPGRAFFAGNIIYVPCMGENITTRIKII